MKEFNWSIYNQKTGRVIEREASTAIVAVQKAIGIRNKFDRRKREREGRVFVKEESSNGTVINVKDSDSVFIVKKGQPKDDNTNQI